MKSICASVEEKVLQALRGLDGLAVPVFGLLETAAAGEVKQEDLTALQCRVYGFSQPHEAYGLWSASMELRLTVEQAESANGQLFYDGHEAVALWLQRVMIGDLCTGLDTDEVNVDGFQIGGGDADYDTSNGAWFAVWTVTLSGRLKEQSESEES